MAGKRASSKSSTVTKKTCANCGAEKNLTKEFYASDNPIDSHGRVSMCKECCAQYIDYSNLETVKSVLHQINKPFLMDIWENSVEESKKENAVNTNIFSIYMKNFSLKHRGKRLTWIDSDALNQKTIIPEDSEGNRSIPVTVSQNELYSIQDQKNKEDVIRMVGYDPFEYDSDLDKKQLYNKLIDYLDDSTLEDSFKLPAVIEIVKTFMQIEKINVAISSIAANSQAIVSNSGSIKSLMDTKKKMLDSVLALAKDNGISVNHNNNKSKGAGTLSGIIKQLQEKGIDEGRVNVYDIETCDGMKQVADVSNRSILEQLMLNENDYTEMIKDQRELLVALQSKSSDLEEENRLLKIKISTLEGQLIIPEPPLILGEVID